MSVKRQFISGMFSGAGSVVLKTTLSIILIPTLLYKLGADLYGLFVLLVGTLDLLLMLDMGFTTGLIKLLGTYQNTGDRDKSIQLLSLGHGLYGILAIFLFLGGILLLPWCLPLFHLTFAQENLANTCLLIILLESAITLYAGYYKAILVSQSWVHWTNIAESLYYIVGNVFAIASLYLGYGLEAILLARLGAAVLRLFLLGYKARHIESYTFYIHHFKNYNQEYLASFKELLGMSCHAAILNTSVFISHKMDNFIIAACLPLKSVGIFEIVFRFLGNALQIVFKISEGLFPLFTKLSATAEHNSARRIFLKMSSLNNFVISLLLMCVVFFYPQLFTLFSAGAIPIEPTLPILKVAVPIIWSGALQIPACHYLFVSGHERYVTLSSIITALCNVGLSLFLIQVYGLIGVALGTLIPQLIQHQFGLIRKTCKELHIPILQYITLVHLKTLAPVVLAYGVLSFSTFMLQTHIPVLFYMASASLLAALCGGICWLSFNLSLPEKQTLLKDFRRFPKIRATQKVKVING